MLDLPSNKAVKDVIEGLLFRDVTMDSMTSALTPADAVGGMIATYVDDEGRLCALLGWSLAAAAQVGCCLGLIPAPMAKEMTADKSLRADVIENVTEVSNVMASALNQAGGTHVRMVDCYEPTASAPPSVTALLFTPANALDWNVTVKGYGSGHLRVVCV